MNFFLLYSYGLEFVLGVIDTIQNITILNSVFLVFR